MARKDKFGVSLYIPTDLYKDIKENADLRYMPVTTWILQACLERVLQERMYHGDKPKV